MGPIEAADPVQRAFLGVERSAAGNRWVSRLDQAGQNRALAMAQTHGMADLIARVLAGRGVGLDEAMAFLDPTIRGLMPDLTRDPGGDFHFVECAAPRTGSPSCSWW